MSLVRWLRTRLHGDDVQHALDDEAALIAADQLRRSRVERRQLAAFASDDVGAVELGTMVAHHVPLRVPASRLLGHVGVWGPSGAGKSYLVASLLMSLVRAGLRRFALFDPKAETVALMRRALVDVAATLPPDEAENLVSRIVLLDPFSTRTLPRLQVLAAEEGVDAELQAYEVANLITHEAEMGVGVRQEAVLHRVIECLIRSSLPLTALPAVLEAPAILDSLAEQAGPAELFRTTAARLRGEPRERVMGLVSRAERLLRLRSTRLALTAPSSINFDDLLNDRIVLCTLEAPQGAVDIARVLCGVLWNKLAHAVRRRPNQSSPCMVVLDEWPAFLAAAGTRAADTTEDLLRLARSKGVFLTLMAQDLVSIAKISSTLPAITRTNLHWHFIFRSFDDWGPSVLPVTGRRLKEPSPPWEEERVGYLERGAELALLREELGRLPDRQCYVLDRRSGLPAVLMRTRDLELRAQADDVAALEERAARSDAVMPVAALEAAERALRERLAALAGRAPIASAPTASTRRRHLAPVDIG